MGKLHQERLKLDEPSLQPRQQAWSIQVWDLNAASSDGLLAVIEDRKKSPRQARISA